MSFQRNATIGFINNFGQIPKQLFKKPHPAKRVTPPASVANGDAATAGTSSSLVNMNSKVVMILSNLDHHDMPKKRQESKQITD